MKKPVIVLFFAVFLWGTIGLAAPTIGEQAQTVAVFDFQRTVQDSVQGKTVLNQLKTKEDSITRKLGEFDDQILSLETRLKTLAKMQKIRRV